MSQSWQPLLEGEPLDRARRALDAIRDGLPRLPVGYPPNQGIRGDSVLDVGLLGQAVFWAYLAETQGGDEPLARAMGCLDRAAEELSRVSTGPSLYAGFLGAGWVTQYLQPLLGASEDEDEEDPNLDIDEALLCSLQAGAARQSGHNLFAGLVGSGVYALERWPRPAAREALERIVQWLASSAEELPGGLSWRTPVEALPEEQRHHFPRGYFNLGLGHGVPGVVALLAGIWRTGVAPANTRELLEGAVSWLLTMQAEVEGRPAEVEGRPAFPRFFIEEREVSVSHLEPSSLSWCFGDPGVAVALLSAARALDHSRWEAAARALAVASAARLETAVDNGGPFDPGFCHGMAGTAHVLNRLFQATGDERCQRASRRGFEELLSGWRRERGETGFMTLPRSLHIPMAGECPEQQEVGGLLRGVAGVGLSLLAAVSDRPPAWDRLMLLST